MWILCFSSFKEGVFRNREFSARMGFEQAGLCGCFLLRGVGLQFLFPLNNPP